VEAQADALRKLHELRRVQFLVEFGLARQDDAQHLVLGGLDAREHAHLFEDARREVLRLIDDQQDLAVRGVLLDQELVQGGEQFGLAHLEGLEAELHEHRLQELQGRHLRLVDLRDDDVRVQFLEEGLDQRGLA